MHALKQDPCLAAGGQIAGIKLKRYFSALVKMKCAGYEITVSIASTNHGCPGVSFCQFCKLMQIFAKRIAIIILSSSANKRSAGRVAVTCIN